MHFVIAALTDPQFTTLQGSSIPFRESPQAFIERLRAILGGIGAEDAVERVLKMAIREGEVNAYGPAEDALKASRVRQKWADLTAELGL